MEKKKVPCKLKFFWIWVGLVVWPFSHSCIAGIANKESWLVWNVYNIYCNDENSSKIDSGNMIFILFLTLKWWFHSRGPTYTCQYFWQTCLLYSPVGGRGGGSTLGSLCPSVHLSVCTSISPHVHFRPDNISSYTWNGGICHETECHAEIGSLSSRSWSQQGLL